MAERKTTKKPILKETVEKIIFDKQILDEKLSTFTNANTFVVTDFSRTLTDFLGPSTWSAISKSGAMPDGYINESQKLFDEYSPIELDEEMDPKKKNKKLCDWWKYRGQLIVGYGLNEKIFETCFQTGMIKFRAGVKEFLEGFYSRGIPVIIISSGIGRFIKKALALAGCENFDNIYIVANHIEFACCTAVKVHKPYIHTHNKQEVQLPKFKGRTNMILFGDSRKDIVKPRHVQNAVQIAFLEDAQKLDEYRKHFDVVCLGDTTFNELTKKVKL